MSVFSYCSAFVAFQHSKHATLIVFSQFVLNNGKPVGASIPATEHSVMTAWRTEKEAIENMVDEFGVGLFATVLDSYDYAAALEKVVPYIAKQKLKHGSFWVLRPDSGDALEAVLMVSSATGVSAWIVLV